MLPESERKMYYSWEIPGDGMCSIDDAPEDIYRMLRAMDYGKSDIFPPARIRLACGRVVEVLRYAKASGSHLKGGEKISVDEKSQRIYLTMDDATELIIKFKERILDILANVNEDILSYTGRNLVNDDIIDSFELISIIGQLEDEFDIEIDAADITEEKFGNKDRIIETVKILIK